MIQLTIGAERRPIFVNEALIQVLLPVAAGTDVHFCGGTNDTVTVNEAVSEILAQIGE